MDFIGSRPGVYSIGSDAANDILVPASAAARIGEFRVGDDGVRMLVEEGVEVLNQDQPVTDVQMPADVTGKGIMLSHASLAWNVIERGGKLAVRIRDYEHPFVATFGPLPYYEIDPAKRVVATLRKYDEPRTITVNTVIEGLQQFPESPGVVEFELDGKVYQLEAQTSANNRLFIVFGDLTNNRETYGAGRFVYHGRSWNRRGRGNSRLQQVVQPALCVQRFLDLSGRVTAQQAGGPNRCR